MSPWVMDEDCRGCGAKPGQSCRWPMEMRCARFRPDWRWQLYNFWSNHHLPGVAKVSRWYSSK